MNIYHYKTPYEIGLIDFNREAMRNVEALEADFKVLMEGEA